MTFNIWLLQIVAFLDLFAVGLIVPLISSHVRALGAGHVYVGLLGSTYYGFQLASGPLIGSLSDLQGRKFVLILTLLICSIAYTILGLIYSLSVILIIRAILGLFKQTQILTKALVPDYEKSERNQSEIFGKIAAISAIGMTTGPVVGGHLAENYPEEGFRLVALIAGVCFFTNAGLIYILSENVKQKKRKLLEKNMTQKLQSTCKEAVFELCKIGWSEYGVVFFFRGLIEFTISLYYSNYALCLKTNYELTPKSIGYLISFQGIIRSISSYFIEYVNMYYTEDVDYSTRNCHVFLGLTLSMLGFILSFNISMYVIFLIPLGISSAIGRLVSLEMVLKRGHDEHRATLIGASNSVRSLSGVIAPTVSGVIGQCFGVTYVIHAAFLVSFIGFLVSFHYKRQKKYCKEKN